MATTETGSEYTDKPSLLADDVMHIVCATDENYLPHLAALLKSIDTHSTSGSIHVHILNDGVRRASQDKIAGLVPRLGQSWYDTAGHVALSLPPLLQISRATYLRLIMDELLDPSIRRVLYLDIDMIATASLWPLWRSDLSGRACGAVVDPGVDANAFAKKHALGSADSYFNAGMLLLDLDQIRRDSLLLRALRLLIDDPDQSRFEYADQDALNIVFHQRWHELDATWNFQREYLYDDLASWRSHSKGDDDLPAIIHFTESMKPWKSGEWHPYAWLYWRSLLQTPFAAKVRKQAGVGPLAMLKLLAKFHFRRPNLRTQ